MDHYRTHFSSRAGRISQVEALRQIVIELDGRHLPFPLERVGHVNLDLRAIERAFLRIELESDFVTAHRFSEFLLAHPPLLFGTEMLIGHCGELELGTREAEG